MNTSKLVPTLLKNAYGWLREVSGDDAYERYLRHWQEKHAQQGGQPMTRKEFFASEQDRKWNGIRRCC